MNKEAVAAVLLIIGTVGLARLVAVVPMMRRVYLCLFFVGALKIVDINFVSRENYRGWVRGFEVGSQDMLLLALFSAILLGASRHPPRLFPPMFITMAPYILIAMISMAAAYVPLYGAFGLAKLVRYAITYWIIANAVWDEKDLSWLMWTLVGCVGMLAGISARDYLGGVYRARAVFDHSNTLGMYLNMLLPIVFALLLNLRTRLGCLLLAIFGVGVSTVVLTLSRGAWVSMVLALAVVLPVSFALRFRPRKLLLIAIMGVLALPPGIVAAQKMIRRMQEAPESSGEARTIFNQVARQMAGDHVVGVGVNNYSYGTDQPYSAPFAGGLDQGGLCHNLYYLTAGELGWGGLVALLAVLLTPLVRAGWFLWRHLDEGWRSNFMLGWFGGLLTVLFQSTLEWAMLQATLAMTFFGLLGITSAILRMRPGSSVTRWRVTVYPAKPPAVFVPARPTGRGV